MPAVPESARHLVIGAGVHGLSTAWHLAAAGEEALVVDKSMVGAGASGIACGVIRNNYFQPAMQELMAACVEIWESDPDAFHYHGVRLRRARARRPRRRSWPRSSIVSSGIGYPSELHTGERRGRRPHARHVRRLACGGPDASASTSTPAASPSTASPCSGSPTRPAARARRSLRGSRSPGSPSTAPAPSRGVQTAAGEIEVDQVVVAVGPWIASLWEMLGLARPHRRSQSGRLAWSAICRCGPTGTCRRERWRCRPRR